MWDSPLTYSYCDCSKADLVDCDDAAPRCTLWSHAYARLSIDVLDCIYTTARCTADTDPAGCSAASLLRDPRLISWLHRERAVYVICKTCVTTALYSHVGQQSILDPHFWQRRGCRGSLSRWFLFLSTLQQFAEQGARCGQATPASCTYTVRSLCAPLLE
jgi:hypothetical protein